MIGTVEVFSLANGEKTLVSRENNLIVDGAGEGIVDMLTAPSSTLAYAPEVMDTSNWRFGAMSFGPAASFNEGAYHFPEVMDSITEQRTTDNIVRVQQDTIGDVSNYTPPQRLGIPPSPADRVLVNASTAYASVSSDGTECFGQYENRIMFASGDPSSYFQGCFLTVDNTSNFNNVPQGRVVSSFDGDFVANPDLNTIIYEASADGLDTDNGVNGGFNFKNNMDWRGFAGIVYSFSTTFAQAGSPSFAAAGGADGVNANSIPVVYGIDGEDGVVQDLITDPRVVIELIIYDWDLWAMNLYGGLHTLGLWGIDCMRSLQNSYPPLEEDHVFNPATETGFVNPETGRTKKEFKLFAKKKFTENLAQNTGNGSDPGFHNPGPLVIKWVLDFRSIHD